MSNQVQILDRINENLLILRNTIEENIKTTHLINNKMTRLIRNLTKLSDFNKSILQRDSFKATIWINEKKSLNSHTTEEKPMDIPGYTYPQ